MTVRDELTAVAPRVRCYTRALKNARYLQANAPGQFARDPSAEGFGTGVPLEILRILHRVTPESPLLDPHEQLAAFMRRNHTPPRPVLRTTEALFNGTIHFVQITFHTPGGDFVTTAADMKQIIQYAQHAIVPIQEYVSQYGPNAVAISPELLTYTADVPKGTYTYEDVRGWVNQLAAENDLPVNSCIFIISPQGISSASVDWNAGYHSHADIPYAVAGVFAAGLTLADNADAYAMVVSHEIAEMVVDPAIDGLNPEVCDPCDSNSNNLTRCYFDAADNYLGSNQVTPPDGFAFCYYTCAVVKADAVGSAVSPANCEYAPVPG